MKAKTKKRGGIFTTRHGVMLIALLAIMILVVNLITASYSWFRPASISSGSDISYQHTSALRSQNCSISGAVGTMVTDSTYTAGGKFIDDINYDNSVSTKTLASGETGYFMTTIANADEDNGTNVSLYYTDFPANCSIGVSYPSNSYRKFTAKQEIYIIRNAYVKQKVLTDGNAAGILEVEWFVTNNSSSAVTINLSNVFLVYN